MAFADPVAVELGVTWYDLNKIFSSGSESRYRYYDGTADTLELVASHTTNKSRVRHLLKLSQQRTAADVYQPSVNTLSSMSAHLVVDVPQVGFTATEQLDLVTALNERLSVASYSLAVELLRGES